MLQMRTSERGSLKRCPQQWYWSQVEGLRPNTEASPLWFGSAVHEALAEWYLPGLKRGPHPAETFEKVLEGDRSVRINDEGDEELFVNARELGVDMLVRYVEEYGTDDHWDVIATEHQGNVILPRRNRVVFGHRLPDVQHWLRYNFTWDGVYRDLRDGQIKLMEHKTAASISVEHLPLDDQAGSYWAIASQILQKNGTLKKGEEIVAIEYNFLRKAMRDERPRNANGYYTNKPQKVHYLEALADHFALTGKETIATLEGYAETVGITVLGEQSARQPPAFFERHTVYRSRAERRMQIERIKDEALLAEAYRKGHLPIVKAPDRQHCNWCPFKRMCQLHESGDMEAVEAFKETQYHVEDPYSVYKKSA
jgi:hypothetical protein